MSTGESQKEASMTVPTPEKEHKWLQQLVGEWTFEGEALMGPDKPAEACVGSETVRSIGEIWVQCEGQMGGPDGAPAVSQMTLGYDPIKKSFVGTFIVSMMTHLWIYERGELDSAEKVLTLFADGPSFEDPTKTAKYKDVIEVKSSDHRILRSNFLGPDGQWIQFMTTHYRKKK